MLGFACETRRDEQTRRGAFARRQKQPPRGREIIDFGKAPDLADHRGGRAAFQSLLHGPEAFLRIARRDQHEAAGIYAQKRQPRPIKCARLARGLGLDDPDDGRAGLCRSPGKTRSQGKGKTGGRRAGGRTSRDDLMQGAAFKPALQGAIEAARLLRIAQSHPRRPAAAGVPASARRARAANRLQSGDFRAQKIHPFRRADRHRSGLR